MVWTLLLGILLDSLIRFYLHELPYKFLIHTIGPIRRLGQYSKKVLSQKTTLQSWGIVMPLDSDHVYTTTPGVGGNLSSQHITCFIRFCEKAITPKTILMSSK